MVCLEHQTAQEFVITDLALRVSCLKIFTLLLLLLILVISCSVPTPQILIEGNEKAININHGEVWRGVFNFKNVGKKSLIINSVNSDCGVIVAYYPKSGVNYNDSDSIVFYFESTTTNPGISNRSILLETNTEELLIPLKIKANVMKN